MSEYQYSAAEAAWDDEYIWRGVKRRVESLPRLKAFDLGCGNGVAAKRMAKLGFQVTAVDPSHSGIAIATGACSSVRFAVGSAYDDLASAYGTFPLVYSIEVIEHVNDPRLYAKRFFDLLAPGGVGIITTPYHGWLKNVVISVAGKWDSHHGTLWEGGHIKFFSPETLAKLLMETGFKNIDIERVGRVPPLAKSMIATFTR